MTKRYFIELADFNIWANNNVHAWFEKITDAQWEQPIVSSFNSIAATSLHITSAETVWLDRLNKVPSPVWLADTFKGSKKEVLALWNKASENLKLFVEEFDESQLHNDLAFKRLNGELYEMPYYQVLAHIFNHSTYHRGQIVTMLRQAGFTSVGSTDLMVFNRQYFSITRK